MKDRELRHLHCSILNAAAWVFSIFRGHRKAPPPVPFAPAEFNSLYERLQDSYLDIFDTAREQSLDPSRLRRMREYLSTAEDYCMESSRKGGVQTFSLSLQALLRRAVP